MRSILVRMAALCLVLVIGNVPARAEEERRQGLIFTGKDGEVPAPVLGSTIEVRVTGIVARTKVTQVFENVSQEWLEGIYLFPLPEGAAVDTLRMKVGGRTIRGVIQKKEEARQAYEAAKQEGRKASLVEQQRPDVFSTAVANVGPGETVEVSIELQQVVRWDAGRFSLRFPLLVAPHPGAACNPFSFHADLNPGFPLAKVASPNYAITVEKAEKGRSFRYAVDLAKGVETAGSDLVLEWAPAVGREPRAVYYSEEVDGERYSLLMVMPPDDPGAVAARLPRETTFIVDVSGSMDGTKLEQARQALLFGLGRLQPMDRFNVVRFSDKAEAVFPAAVPATPANVEAARRWVQALKIEGGTHMLPALEIAFRQPPAPGLVPQVIFATDGQLEDEPDVVRFLNANLGERRLFPVAIGMAPNASLLGRLAELGRGTFTAVDDEGKVSQAMGALFSRLEAPMLRDLGVEWGDPGAEAWPARVPDLYLGEPLVVTARTAKGSGPVTVSGLRGDDAWQDSFPAAAEVQGAGLDKLWARKKIHALTEGLTVGADAGEVTRAVTALGLRHHLVTDHTSLVAVDETPTAPLHVELMSREVPAEPGWGSGAAVQDCIVVTAESPMLDERRIRAGATVSQTELEKIPTSRDPWSLLQSTPGVLTDRVNVGGNESGQQSRYVGPGSKIDQAVWSVDGAVLTDMAALGSSPVYYDFEAFEEMQVTTGGSDAAAATGGVTVNLVTKRGTNEWRGSGRLLAAPAGLQSDPEAPGDRVERTSDAGAEIGGPLAEDRLWIWGAYARQRFDRRAAGGARDDTRLAEWNVKLNAQVTGSNGASAFAWGSDKRELGRGAGLLRPRETSWEESGSGPTAWKLEDTQVVSSNAFLTGMVSRVDGGFRLEPLGGDRRPFRDADLIWHGSYLAVDARRPQRQARLDGSRFFQTGQTAHELRFGSVYRIVEPSSTLRWPGGGFETETGADGARLLVLARDAAPRIDLRYGGLFLQDTLTAGRLTAHAGLRWDRQGGRYAGGDAGFRWSDVTPRLGLTWALGQDRDTLLRASYARFADQLGAATASGLDPLAGFGYRYFDAAGTAEVRPPSGNVDPVTLGALRSNAVDPELGAPLTDEVLLGVEHSPLPEFVIGLNLTYRRIHRLLEAERLLFDADDPFAPALLGGVGRVHRRSDYVERFSAVPYWELRPGVSTRGGFRLENGDREQEYRGASLVFDKRLADGWMLRGNVSWRDWTWRIPAGENEDPTDAAAGGIVDGTSVLQGPDTAFGPEGGVFLAARWSYSVSGLYQIAPDRPWGFDVAASANGRQGYPLRWAERVDRRTIPDGAAGIDVPLHADPDAARYPDLHVLDLRVQRELAFSDFGVTLGLDVFNALSRTTVLRQQTVVGRSDTGAVLETLSPRVFRIGARISYR